MQGQNDHDRNENVPNGSDVVYFEHFGEQRVAFHIDAVGQFDVLASRVSFRGSVEAQIGRFRHTGLAESRAEQIAQRDALGHEGRRRLAQRCFAIRFSC